MQPDHDAVDRAGTVDRLVERTSRATRDRISRRSFLGRASRTAMVIAGGSALVPYLAGPAGARVCGQSGVAPKCPTFDCDREWGWCWYASGCCADGALKKICDCCAPNTPHPVGYCPSGTRVYCIVESCGADPRLQTVEHRRLTEAAPSAISVAASRHRFDRADAVVVGDGGRLLRAAQAMSLGGVVAGPVLLTQEGLDAAVAEEIERLGAEAAVVVGRDMGEVASDLEGRGLHVDQVGTSTDNSTGATQVARWHRERTGQRRAVIVLDDAPSTVLASAAAFAHAVRVPLLLGDNGTTRDALEDIRPIRETWVVGPGAADRDFPGMRALSGGDAAEAAAAVGDAADTEGVPLGEVVLAPEAEAWTAMAGAAYAAPLLLHQSSTIDGATFDWLLSARSLMNRVTVVGGDGTLSDQGQWELQGLVNEFEVHQLTGSAGEGLPVIPQPPDERPIGEARR
ncbi:hypothetical protein ER308_05995 [Egibacter rhizosphaerae]|uniref:Twin-arginine translocation signal domain-containing protein n=1 Tax=Egibacter rhizosphaerae TaxID=1670831 RepID=A0A411YD51_9ACTN|nr:hypothetical protein [Egibacter rhizosphaerae]QBI19134.1 hypothetical protein ER308_05995 [Egibacter rhizosphaerae]